MLSPEEILIVIDKNPLLDGVTLSGGEPFCQSAQLLPLANAVRARGLHLAAYTGFTFEELLEDPDRLALVKTLDIIIDGPFILAQKDFRLKYKGSHNQRIIDVPASLLKKTVVLETSERWN